MFNVILTNVGNAWRALLVDANSGKRFMCITRPTRDAVIGEIEDLTTDL